MKKLRKNCGKSSARDWPQSRPRGALAELAKDTVLTTSLAMSAMAREGVDFAAAAQTGPCVAIVGALVLSQISHHSAHNCITVFAVMRRAQRNSPLRPSKPMVAFTSLRQSCRLSGCHAWPSAASPQDYPLRLWRSFQIVYPRLAAATRTLASEMNVVVSMA